MDEQDEQQHIRANHFVFVFSFRFCVKISPFMARGLALKFSLRFMGAQRFFPFNTISMSEGLLYRTWFQCLFKFQFWVYKILIQAFSWPLTIKKTHHLILAVYEARDMNEFNFIAFYCFLPVQ